MIPESFVEQWRAKAPSLSMIEQDLIISRALIELYCQPEIQSSLIFRGGTALNKLYSNPPVRYSEDIDFVQFKAEPIGNTLNIIRKSLDNWLGMPKRKLTERGVKLIYRYSAVDDTPAKLKIEINTTEHFHAQPLNTIRHAVNTEWFTGESQVVTYEINELIATKLRALYQRRKGRDLFDLWWVLKNNLINPTKVIEIFTAYANYNHAPISRAAFEKNIFEKEQDASFGYDMNLLLSPMLNWSVTEAFNIVKSELLRYLPGETWRGNKDKAKNLKESS